MARILVVDDDITTRLMIGTILTDRGHIPIFSGDGQHAYETLMIDDTIDLLITDVMMPRLDGRDLIKLLRGIDHYARLPVIVISSVVGPREIAGLLELGASRFLSKPIARDELLSSVNDALTGDY